MARERERIFSLSRFATQAETEADEAYKEAKKQAYTRIYGGEDNIPHGKDLSPRVVQAMMDDEKKKCKKQHESTLIRQVIYFLIFFIMFIGYNSN